MKKLPKKLYAYRAKWGLVCGEGKDVVEAGEKKEVGVYELVGRAVITNRVKVDCE